MSRDELLRKITALDFYIIDLHLYLNTHPTYSEAIRLYNESVMQAKALREEYQKAYGMLLANNSLSREPWQWIEAHGPGRRVSNFELGGETG